MSSPLKKQEQVVEPKKREPQVKPKQYYPDPTHKKPRGSYIYWCPFCAGYHKFKHCEWLGVRVCNSCGISIREFWVRQANGLWR